MIQSFNHPKRNQGGFSLIDVLLALGVVILISGITLTGIRRTNESNQAKAVGEQIKSVGAGLNTYVSLRYDTLVTAIPGTDDIGTPGTAADPGPRSCVCAVGSGACATPGNVKICTITSETLRRNGLLPSNFSGVNAFGSTYEYRIRIQPQGGGTSLVDGLVWTRDAYTMEGEIRYDLLGQAMMVAGADSAMTRSVASTLEGFNGAWTEIGTNAGGINVNRLGVLGFRVGYNTFGYAAYLRLSGGEMLGDIDMGNNNIFNIETLKAQDVAADRLNVRTGDSGIVFRNDFNRNNANGMPTLAADAPRIGSTGNTLVLRSNAPVRFEGVTTGAMGTVQMGRLESETGNVTGTLDANNIRVGGATAVSPGGISSQGTIVSASNVRGNMVVAGSVAGTNNYAAMANSAQGGAIYFNTNINGGGGTRGFSFNNADSTIYSSGGNFTVSGGDVRAAIAGGTGGRIRGERSVVAGAGTGDSALVTLDGTVRSVGSACASTQVGTIANGGGVLVQCTAQNFGTLSYAWRTISNSTNSISTIYGGNACTGAGGAEGATASATCPANGVALSGGYIYVSGAPRRSPLTSERVGANSWRLRPGPTIAYTGDTTTTQGTCWQAFVVCSN